MRVDGGSFAVGDGPVARRLGEFLVRTVAGRARALVDLGFLELLRHGFACRCFFMRSDQIGLVRMAVDAAKALFLMGGSQTRTVGKRARFDAMAQSAIRVP